MKEQANAICRTEFVPPSLRGKPEAVLAAILTGRELGIGPMQSLQQIGMIDGKPSLAAELQRALVFRAGHMIQVVRSDNERATLAGRRRDTNQTDEVTWTLEDASRAGLCTIVDGKPRARSQQDRPLPWERYTRAMLVARATSELVSRLFPEVLAGISYTSDELSDGQWVSAVDASGDVMGERPMEGEIVGEGDPAAERAALRTRIEAMGTSETRALLYKAIYGDREWKTLTLDEVRAFAEALGRAQPESPQAAQEDAGGEPVGVPHDSATAIVGALRDTSGQPWTPSVADTEASGDAVEERAVLLRDAALTIEAHEWDEAAVKQRIGGTRSRKGVARLLAELDLAHLREAVEALEKAADKEQEAAESVDGGRG